MTDSMNFGPEWLRNLSSEGSTGGGSTVRYQLAEYRYGREEMLALYEKGLRPPGSLSNSSCPIYSEQALPPLALIPATDEERSWQPRAPPNSIVRGRGGSLERGGRVSRGRGAYQTYGRGTGYEAGGGGGWGNNGEQPDWSPRKEYGNRSNSVDNWRRNRTNDEDDGWRSANSIGKGPSEKWGRSTSWRDGDGGEERSGGPPERGARGWHEMSRGTSHQQSRRSWEDEMLPEWATENLSESGGTFDAAGAFHGSDDEQLETRQPPSRREPPLQKSASQQSIPVSAHSSSLPTSKSSTSLSKAAVDSSGDRIEEEKHQSKPPNEGGDDNKERLGDKNGGNHERIVKTEEKGRVDRVEEFIGVVGGNSANGYAQQGIVPLHNRVEEDFDKLQEDLVLKLVVDEETPKYNKLNFDMSSVQAPTQPPPNLAPPSQEKWYYQDPQGDTQGPFLPSEMAEWFRAGYFNTSLMVKREYDSRFCMLGELVRLCAGNPFLSNVRIAPLKVVEAPKVHDSDSLHYQLLLQNQVALRNATARALSQTEPWGGLSAMQQRDLVTQHMLSSPPHGFTENQRNTSLSSITDKMPPDLAFLQQQQAHPFMHVMNQLQQGGKIQGPNIPDKPPNSMPVPLDPIQALVQQMGGLQSLQQRLPSALPATLQGGGAGGGLPANLQPVVPGLQATLPNDLPGLPMTNLQGGLTLPPRPAPLGAVDPLSSAANESDPIKNLLRQLQNQKQQQTQQMDSLWQQNHFQSQPAMPQWQQQQPEVPIPPLWDLQPPAVAPIPTSLPIPVSTTTTEVQQQQQQQQPQEPPKPIVEKEHKAKDEHQPSAKELKKKKEQEEKQAKKDQEEKRKQEQKRLELEKKAAEEKRKKDEERVRKELEKAKREAEEKRLRELEEKRRLKEQRKAEEAKKRAAEELKKQEEAAERARLEAKDREEATTVRQSQPLPPPPSSSQSSIPPISKAAPWSHSNLLAGTSMEEIQKAERQKRAEQAALLQQQRALQQQQLQQQQLQQQQEQQQNADKPGGLQLKWASKPVENRKVKSFAEIQAEEEQERLAKQIAEARLKEQKEKETVPVLSAGIWSGQNLTWATNSNSTSQWSNNAASGFWDELSYQKSSSSSTQSKPSTLSKSVSSSAVNTTQARQQQQQQQQKQSKSKSKREEQQVMKVFNNGPSHDEFTEWCIKALTDISSSVDVPTFVTFLRDIESAMDVREYCKEYLGEGAAMQQFASEFLEKRRLYKPKTDLHKDDMCSPAPAITPSAQHNTEFQEVKGKSKKSKKSKMMKVDSRILGFNVTAAQDRINVGDLERGDNL